MKKLLLITSAALIGLVSQATAALTVTPVAESALAGELRSLSFSDWATINTSGSYFSTTLGMTLSRDDSIDDGAVTLGSNQSLVIESIYKDARYVNDFGVVDTGALNPSLLTNLDLNESLKISSNANDSVELGFAADITTLGDKGAGVVTSSINDNVHTLFKAVSGDQAVFVWMLEDWDIDWIYRDNDFNDFIVLGTLSAVPEPSTIISLIAVGFLGFVTWRNRRKAKA